MSSQLQQQQPNPNVVQQQQPPFTAYPNTITGQPLPPSQSHSHTDGSFGTVFIVLAAIVVVSAVACCLGRFCNRRQNSRPKQSYPTSSRPPRENDMEFGFDKKVNSHRRENHVEFGFDKKVNHNEVNPKQSRAVPQDKENEIEFAFDRKVRKPNKVPGNGEFGSGYKPSMDSGFHHGSKPSDEI